MGLPHRARPTDIVKVELGLSSGQYEAIYTAFATRMQEEGLIGAQMRSIQSKAAARRIGADVRRNHRRVLGGVSDTTFDTNILRIAQRINSNIRRVKQRKGQADARRKEADHNCDTMAAHQDSTLGPPAERLRDTWDSTHITPTNDGSDEPRPRITPRKRQPCEDHARGVAAPKVSDMARSADTSQVQSSIAS